MTSVDAQVHLWAAARPGEPLFQTHARRAHRPGPWRTEQMLAGMDEAGADRAVIVPPSWTGEDNAYSLLPCFSVEPYPFRDLTAYLRHAYDAFGPQRLLWGTDYTRLPCSYREAIDHIRASLDFLTTEDKEWILGRAALAWLAWPA